MRLGVWLPDTEPGFAGPAIIDYARKEDGFSVCDARR